MDDGCITIPKRVRLHLWRRCWLCWLKHGLIVFCWYLSLWKVTESPARCVFPTQSRATCITAHTHKSWAFEIFWACCDWNFWQNPGCWDGGALLGSTCFCLWFAKGVLWWNLRMSAGAMGYRSAAAPVFQTQLQHWGSGTSWYWVRVFITFIFFWKAVFI